MEKQTIKMKLLREKYLQNSLRNQFLKVENSLLEFRKDFMELHDIESKNRETNIKREIIILKEKLFFKMDNVTIKDVDSFEKIKMKKIRPTENTWYDWLISYIPEPIRKSVSAFKPITLEQTVPEQTVYGRGQKLSKPKNRIIKKPFITEANREKIKDLKIKATWNLFDRKEEKKERDYRKNMNIMKS